MADEQRRRRQNAQQGNQGANSSTSQPQQQQNQQPQNQPRRQQQSQGPNQNQRDQSRQAQEEGENVEEVREELEERQSELEQKLEKLDEEEGDHRGDFVGAGTIIHEAQQVAYHHYGQTNPLDRDDYIDPVDLFFIIPEVFELRYGEKFKRLIKLKHGENIPILNKVLPRFNRRMINYKYIYALQGIKRARKEDQISFKISDRAKFNLYLRFPAIGPPLIFWPFFNSEERKEKGRLIAERITEHGVTEQEVEEIADREAFKQEVQSLQRDLEYYQKQIEEVQQKIKQAKKNNNIQKVQYLKDQLTRYGNEAREAKDKLDAAHEQWQKTKKRRGS